MFFSFNGYIEISNSLDGSDDDDDGQNGRFWGTLGELILKGIPHVLDFLRKTFGGKQIFIYKSKLFIKRKSVVTFERLRAECGYP